MKDVMGVITITDNDKYLPELTHDRVLPAIPFGGRYRIIDFTLSCMVNSGIENVGVFINHKSRSLLDHLRSGKDWDLHRKKNGLFLLPVDDTPGQLRGELKDFHKHLDYFNTSAETYVLISSGNVICNLVFNDAVNFHKDNNADITVIYKEEEKVSNKYTTIKTNEQNRVIDMEVNPIKISSKKISTEMYILKKELLIDLVSTCIARGQYSLVMDGIIKNLNKLRIFAFPYKGYLYRIVSNKDYYKSNMDFLDPQNLSNIFSTNPIYTKVKNEAPTKYGENSFVSNSLIASGCIINGKVENSIIFRNVIVEEGAVIKNCIIMPKIIIRKNTYLECVVLDKDVCINAGKILKGDSKHPIFISKRTVI